MRYMTVWLALVSILGLTPVAAQALSWEERGNRVRYQSLQNPKWTTHENELTIKSSARTFNVSPALMLCIGHRESGEALNEQAVNSSSGTSGLFQHMPHYWPGRVAAYNRAVGSGRPWLKVGGNVFASRSNALVSAWMIRHVGTGPWGGACG